MMIKSGFSKWLGLILLILFLFLVLSASDDEEDRINWVGHSVRYGYGTTIDVSDFQGKPGMLYFYASTTSSLDASGEGRGIDRLSTRLGLPKEILRDEEVVALSRKFSCFSVNIDSRPHIFTKYNVIAFPTVIFTDPWGNEVRRCTGAVTADVLISLMKAFPTDFSKVIKWNELLNQDSKNFESLKGMADFYLNLGAWDISNQFNNKALKTEQVQANQELKESLILMIGLNELRMKHYKKAQEAFENCLKEVPKGNQGDKALLGLIIAQLGQNRISIAEKNLVKLKSRYPESPAVQQANRYIKSVKESTSQESADKRVVDERSGPLRVLINVDNASLKETPALTGRTLARIPLYTLLEVELKQGDWYKVYIEKEGIKISGFIHEMLVKVVQ